MLRNYVNLRQDWKVGQLLRKYMLFEEYQCKCKSLKKINQLKHKINRNLSHTEFFNMEIPTGQNYERIALCSTSWLHQLNNYDYPIF